MKHLYHAKSSANTLEDNLIPMINIIFLLLIFFMIAGQISSINNMQGITAPNSNSDKPAKQQAMLLTVSKTGDYYLDNQPVTPVQLEEAISQAPQHTMVNVLADKNLTAGELDATLTLLKTHQIAVVTLLTKSAEAKHD